MQPGDNFRVVASPLNNFGSAWRAAQTNDHGAIVTRSDIEIPSRYTTPMLTVWRRLHVEVDSMGAVVSNFVSGAMNDFVGSGSSTTQIMVSATLGDGSPDLDGTGSSYGNGRLESGTLTIGNGPGATVTLANITGNSANRLTFGTTAIVPVWFQARDNDWFPLPPPQWLSGNVTEITKSGGSFVYSLQIMNISNGGPVEWDDYTGGGWISVGAGAQLPITAVNSNAITFTTASLNVPFNVADDDVLSGDVPGPDTSGMEPIWKDAYVKPLFDTGFSNGNAPFHLNTENATFGSHMTESKGSSPSTADYWVVLVKNGYQTGLADDADPNTEMTYRAAAVPSLESLLMLEESIRDWIASSNSPPQYGGGGVDPDPSGDSGRQARRQEILNHEVGHLFGLDHADGEPAAAGRPNGDVMAPSCCPPYFTRKASVFGVTSLDKIRDAPKPNP